MFWHANRILPIYSYRGDEKLTPNKHIKITHEDDKCTLTVTKAPLGYAGKYTCVATNVAGEAKIDANIIISGKREKEIVY